MLLGLCGVAGTGSVPRRDAVFAEGELGTPGEWRMVLHGFEKLVAGASMRPTHLFDLRRDPYELNNLVEEPARRRQREDLLARLRRWAADTTVKR